MAVNYFLKINGITGESTDPQYHGDLVLESWSWGGTQSINLGSAGAGAGAGKASFSDLSVMVAMDSTTPPLFSALASGAHIASASLYAVKTSAGPSETPFFTMQLNQVYVSSLQLSGGGDVPQVAVALKFASVQFLYTPTSASGSMGTQIEAGWNTVTNAAL